MTAEIPAREHIAATRAKLTDEDSIALFGAFLVGDMEQVLASIIERRVEAATADARAHDQEVLEQRFVDVRAELRRQIDAADRRAAAAEGRAEATRSEVIQELNRANQRGVNVGNAVRILLDGKCVEPGCSRELEDGYISCKLHLR